MTTREALEALFNRHGALTPQLIVDEARAGATPEGVYLAGMLTWDDQEAAEKHRLSQARGLIQRVRVTFREATEEDQAVTVRAYSSLASGTGVPGYVRTDEALADPVQSEIVIREALRQWHSLRRRYMHLTAFRQKVAEDLAAVPDGETSAAA